LEESLVREKAEIKSRPISFKGKGTQPPWKNNKNDSDLDGIMSRTPNDYRLVGEATHNPASMLLGK
jgi:hypothetical protein